jgi:hypothetical protein
MALTPSGAPVRRWQATQWQADTFSGASGTVTVSDPHEQWAFTSFSHGGYYGLGNPYTDQTDYKRNFFALLSDG